MTYLLSIDQGTTSSRAIIFDESGTPIGSSQLEFQQFFPNDGWVEHCPNEILTSCLTAIEGALKKAQLTVSQLSAIGITNQRETVVVWDKSTGEPIYPAIVWQDRRTASLCSTLKTQGLEETVSAKTGLLLDPYFSASKIAWVLDNVEDARERANNGELAAGTIDTWLVWKLSGGASHTTDATNASRTSLFNIHENRWDPELCELFAVPMSILPMVHDSASQFGEACIGVFESNAVQITGVAGDQQAALIGQCAFDEGAIKSTYGTGCFVIANTGTNAVKSEHRLLTTIAYRINNETYYGIEGSIFIAGAGVQWLRDELQIIQQAADSEAILARTPLDHGVTLVPAFTGLGAPYWDADARGALFGMKRNTGRDEIISATLQSVALQTDDLLQALRDDGLNVNTLRIDGGMSANAAFCQLLSDLTSETVVVPSCIETTALGAAYLAAVGAGIYDSLEHARAYWAEAARYTPHNVPEIDNIKQRWKKCISATIAVGS